MWWRLITSRVGASAGDMLCERGYRKLAFLGGPPSATSTEDRLRWVPHGPSSGRPSSHSGRLSDERSRIALALI